MDLGEAVDFLVFDEESKTIRSREHINSGAIEDGVYLVIIETRDEDQKLTSYFVDLTVGVQREAGSDGITDFAEIKEINQYGLVTVQFSHALDMPDLVLATELVEESESGRR